MAMQQWDPIRDLLQLRGRVNQLIDEVLERSGEEDGIDVRGGRGFTPPVDLFERSDRYVLRVDLPGVAPRDVDIRVEDGTLRLTGERRVDETVARDAFLRIERPSGPFLVEVTLPSSVDAPHIHARHEAGVVEINLPKRDDRPKSPIHIELNG